MESFAVVVLLVFGALPWLAAFDRFGERGRVVLRLIAVFLVCAPVLLAIAALVQTAAVTVAEKPANRPIDVQSGGYVSSQTCQACHPQNHASWHASYHRTMTQVASPAAIVAPFDDVSLELEGLEFRLSRRGDEFWVNMPDPLAPPVAGMRPRIDSQIVMTTGSHHMQVYWFDTGQGRTVAALPFVYLIEQQRWVPQEASFLHPPGSPNLQFGEWNRSCAFCHSTNPRPRVRQQGLADTRVAEFGISCEACHGPGEEHVRANSDPIRRYRLHASGAPDPTIVNPARLSHRRASEICGLCHGVLSTFSPEDDARVFEHGYAFRPGDELERFWFLVSADENQSQPMMQSFHGKMDNFFWPDRMVRVAGREFNGLHATACFQRGELSCLSCHRLHQSADDLRPVREWANDQLEQNMDSNQACLQCHEDYRAQERLVAHTHHPAASSGSLCYNCHMPHTTYGLLKAIRSHQIDSPDVAASLKTGRPNACNQCHLDKSLAWTAEQLSDWYGIEQPAMSDDERRISATLLWLLHGDAAQRSLAAWTLGWDAAHEASGSDWIAPHLAPLLEDPYHAVRNIAAGSLRSLDGFESFQYDYVASPAELAEARRRLLQTWHGRDSEAPKTGDSIMIGPDGLLRQDEVDRLLKQRDDRPVFLAE